MSISTSLTPHQQEVFNAIISNIKYNLSSFFQNHYIEDRLISLSGPAGTGKSYLTTQIVKALTLELAKSEYLHNEGICITAPTHKATNVLRNMLKIQGIDSECRTIQSFLNVRLIYNYDTGEEKFLAIRKTNNPPKASLLIVDESSMISSQLFEYITEAIRVGNVNTVLFIGDPYQLQPVNSKNNKIFELNKQYTLTQIVRQAKDSNIIKLATKLRTCIETQKFCDLKEIIKNSGNSSDIELFTSNDLFTSDFYKNENWYQEDKIVLSYTNKVVDGINKYIRTKFWEEQDVSKPLFLQKSDMIRFKSTCTSIELFGADPRILYQNSEEVMIDSAKSHYSEKLDINIWTCTVADRNKEDFFRVIDPNSEIMLEKLLQHYAKSAMKSRDLYRKIYWKKYFRLRDSFADVQYIFASTIHKSQGSTYNTAYVDLASLINSKTLSNDTKYRLAYVAITRASKKVKLLY